LYTLNEVIDVWLTPKKQVRSIFKLVVRGHIVLNIQNPLRTEFAGRP
jgi:hypothetical protein